MTIGSRGLGRSMLRGVVLCLALALGACTSQQMRNSRDNTLSFFGLARKPAVARDTAPGLSSPSVAVPAADEEPIPSAAPRAPVETEGVTPAPVVGSRTKS
ncbi:MAG: hypothetical protein WDO24_00875 [Pseudomonadota bacterium]